MHWRNLLRAQNSSLHVHTSHSDMNQLHWCTRRHTYLVSNSCFVSRHRKTTTKNYCSLSVPSSQVKDVVPTWAVINKARWKAGSLLTCVTKSWRGVFPFQQDKALGSSVEENNNIMLSLYQTNPCFASLRFMILRIWTCTLVDALKDPCEAKQTKNEKWQLTIWAGRISEASPQMSWGRSLQLSLSKTDRHAKLLLACLGGSWHNILNASQSKASTWTHTHTYNTLNMRR